MTRIFVLPDCQVRPDVPTEHLDWIGRAICHYSPDVVVCLGDFADMESLSSYKTRREAEGLRYHLDLIATHEAMARLLAPLRKKWGAKLQREGAPRMVMLLGNHENRIERAIAEQPQLDGHIGLSDLKYREAGWEVHDFLELVEIEGVVFSHYFQQQGSGRAVSGMIETRIKNIGFAFVHGHQQGYKSGMIARNNGELVRGIVAGSCYLHTEDYMGQTDSAYWRGCLILNDVRHGQFDVLELSLDYLCRKFGPGLNVWKYMTETYPTLSAHSPWIAQEKRSRT